MTKASKLHVYDQQAIKDRLARELPHWCYDAGYIQRRYQTHGWKGTLMVVNTIGHLAEAAWHHPDIRASYAHVDVLLQTHDAKGITEKDFELASKIEGVVMWQPAKENGALEGIPQSEPRFAYLKYES